MKTKHFLWIAVSVASLLPLTAAAVAGSGGAAQEPEAGTTLVDVVRSATDRFRDLEEAISAGYGLAPGCVSGPEEGAMGVHYVNGDLFGDGELDAERPEALVYEARNGRLRLVAVEYIVPADAWHANHAGPPVLMGQLFLYVGSPNRYGGGAFYELHVWAWKNNPNGMFVDWNPKVSCAEYAGEGAAQVSEHGAGH